MQTSNKSTAALTTIHTVAVNIHKSSVTEPKREPAANINRRSLWSFYPRLDARAENEDERRLLKEERREEVGGGGDEVSN